MQKKQLAWGMVLSILILLFATESRAASLAAPKYNSWWGGLGSGGNYTNLGRKSTSSAWGIDLLGFVNPLRWCSIQLGVGVYTQDFIDVARSNVTSWQYTQGRSSKTQMTYAAGLQFLPFNKMTFGVEYHSVRGMTGVVGIKFN